MASRIDSSEGSFMGELEGMETKRLEGATDYAGKLEDRLVEHYTKATDTLIYNMARNVAGNRFASHVTRHNLLRAMLLK